MEKQLFKSQQKNNLRKSIQILVSHKQNIHAKDDLRGTAIHEIEDNNSK